MKCVGGLAVEPNISNVNVATAHRIMTIQAIKAFCYPTVVDYLHFNQALLFFFCLPRKILAEVKTIYQ